MIDTLVAAAINLAVLAAVFVPLERVFPARSRQKVLRRGLWLDGCFYLAQYLVTTTSSVALLRLFTSCLRVHPASLAASPAWVQVPAAIVLGDLLVYFFHRACHRYDVLWRFHAVHHSSEELDWLAAHREHPLDGIATAFVMNLPAIALGVRIELLAGAAVFRGMWSIFVHANVRLPLGALRWVLGAPELHHWHHARLAPGRKTDNFANLAPWIDWVFGTHHDPEEAPGDERFPLGVDEPSPETARAFPAMLARPFVQAAPNDAQKPQITAPRAT